LLNEVKGALHNLTQRPGIVATQTHPQSIDLLAESPGCESADFALDLLYHTVDSGKFHVFDTPRLAGVDDNALDPTLKTPKTFTRNLKILFLPGHVSLTSSNPFRTSRRFRTREKNSTHNIRLALRCQEAPSQRRLSE